jgi:hypothetical protein
MADKLLVLDTREARDRAVEFRAERRKVLTAVTSAGAKVRHDSGGRLIVVDVPPEAEKALAALPGIRVLPLDADVKASLPNLDSTESLFLDALQIRTSREYRDAKSRRKVGESPEERELRSAPDVQEEY